MPEENFITFDMLKKKKNFPLHRVLSAEKILICDAIFQYFSHVCTQYIHNRKVKMMFILEYIEIFLSLSLLPIFCKNVLRECKICIALMEIIF